MPPETKGLPYMEQLPDGTIPLARGEVVALPDADDGAVEYGIIRGIGLSGGVVYLDLEIYDSRVGYAPPAEGEEPQLFRTPFLGGIQ